MQWLKHLSVVAPPVIPASEGRDRNGGKLPTAGLHSHIWRGGRAHARDPDTWHVSVTAHTCKSSCSEDEAGWVLEGLIQTNTVSTVKSPTLPQAGGNVGNWFLRATVGNAKYWLGLVYLSFFKVKHKLGVVWYVPVTPALQGASLG